MRFHLLDPMRGFAALWVFLFHFSYFFEFPDICSTFFKKGGSGIFLFFIISGYCVTGAAQRSIDWRVFLKARLWRIYPTYWAAILVTVVLPYLSPLAQTYDFTRFQVWDFYTWLRVATLTQIFYPVPGTTALYEKFIPINGVYWTFALEIQFYCVVAIALIYRKYFYYTLTLVSIFALVFSWRNWPLPSGIFLPYWLFFASGILLYEALNRGWTPSRIFGALISKRVGIGTLIATVLYFAAPLPIEGSSLGILFTLLLWSIEGLEASFMAWSNHGSIIRRALFCMGCELGMFSFSIYLMHSKFSQFLYIFFSKFLKQSSLLLFLMEMIFTLSLCYVFHILFDRRGNGSQLNLRKVLNRILQAGSATTIP